MLWLILIMQSSIHFLTIKSIYLRCRWLQKPATTCFLCHGLTQRKLEVDKNKKAWIEFLFRSVRLAGSLIYDENTKHSNELGSLRYCKFSPSICSHTPLTGMFVTHRSMASWCQSIGLMSILWHSSKALWVIERLDGRMPMHGQGKVTDGCRYFPCDAARLRRAVEQCYVHRGASTSCSSCFTNVSICLS